MEDNISESEKRKLRSVRTSFLYKILKRTNSQPQSVHYDDTTASSAPKNTLVPSTKRLKFLDEPLEGPAMDSFFSPFQMWPPKDGKLHKLKEKGDSKEHFIIQFYDPNIVAEDACGRTLDDILQCSDMWLEHSHDYIQVLFPLPEGSMFSYFAPIITNEVAEAFHARPELRHRLGVAFTRMLNFYGFTISTEPEEDEHEVEQEDKDKDQSKRDAEVEGHKIEEEEAQPSAYTVADVVDPSPKIGGEFTQPLTYQGVEVDGVTYSQEEDQAPTGGDEQMATSTTADSTNVFVEESGASPAEADSTITTTLSADPQPPPNHNMGYYVIRGENWREAFRNWAILYDHNHLRISRILRCLRVLSLNKECDAFYIALKRVFNDPKIRINERSMMYWRRAARGPLDIAPDGEGVSWLGAWEKRQREMR